MIFQPYLTFSTNELLLSMSWLSDRTVISRRATWMGLALCLAAVLRGYYRPYFTPGPTLLLTVAMTFFIGGIIWAGYRMFGRDGGFPVLFFTGGTLLVSLLRWVYTHQFLRYHLPETTIFHDPARALWFIVPTSAVLLLLGYGLAQYRYLRKQEEKATAAVLNFRSGGKDVHLPVADLLHVKANGEYLLYRCADRQYPRFQRLKVAEAELGPLGFVRVHRSHLVARSAIRTVSVKELELRDGTLVPVSRSYREAVTDIK